MKSKKKTKKNTKTKEPRANEESFPKVLFVTMENDGEGDFHPCSNRKFQDVALFDESVPVGVYRLERETQVVSKPVLM